MNIVEKSYSEHPIDDRDVNSNPLGLKSILTTGSEGSGMLKIILRLEPDKFAPGVSEGEIENASGETDLEVLLPVTVQ